MKWQARRGCWETKMKWHSKFAFIPKLIPEQRYDDILVPPHWVWLERYETRWVARHDEWERRPYTGCQSLRNR